MLFAQFCAIVCLYDEHCAVAMQSVSIQDVVRSFVYCRVLHNVKAFMIVHYTILVYHTTLEHHAILVQSITLSHFPIS